MLETPQHLLRSRVQATEIRFSWDDWDTEAVEELSDDEFSGSLNLISDRAILALTTAIAEWIVYRFDLLNDNLCPWQFLEASWAAGANWKYLAETWDGETEEDAWRGPVRGVIRAAMMDVDEVVYAARLGEKLTYGACSISNIAIHVLPNPEPFREWRSAVLQRLTILYSRNEDDLIGEVVPREAFDLTREFRVFESEVLVNKFLRGLDYRNNPFLSTPEELVADGFEGTPYVFEAASDREQRL